MNPMAENDREDGYSRDIYNVIFLRSRDLACSMVLGQYTDMMVKGFICCEATWPSSRPGKGIKKTTCSAASHRVTR